MGNKTYHSVILGKVSISISVTLHTICLEFTKLITGIVIKVTYPLWLQAQSVQPNKHTYIHNT